MKILLQYDTERFVWGRRESIFHRAEVIEAGEEFWIWETAAEEGGVRFTVEKPYFTEAFEAEDFFLKKGEEVAFRGSKRYECAEDRLEDVVTGTARIAGEEQ